MRAALWVLAFLVLPGGFFVAQCEGIRWFSEGRAPSPLRPLAAWASRLAGRLRRRHRDEPLPPVLLGLELRRLAAEVQRIEDGVQPHRAARLAAALGAYDAVLIELCRATDVPAPQGRPPLTTLARLDLEAELVASGVDW